MINRIWHGYTTQADADIYEDLLKTEIIPGIEGKNIKGYKGFQVLRRELENEVEFMTIITFDRIESVKQFVGEDHEKVYVPEEAQKVLKRYDQKAVHYDLRYNKTK